MESKDLFKADSDESIREVLKGDSSLVKDKDQADYVLVVTSKRIVKVDLQTK